MDRCVSCNRYTKDAEMVEQGSEYICCDCCMVLALLAEEQGPDFVKLKKHTAGKKQTMRWRGPKGSAVGLGGLDIAKPKKDVSDDQ